MAKTNNLLNKKSRHGRKMLDFHTFSLFLNSSRGFSSFAGVEHYLAENSLILHNFS